MRWLFVFASGLNAINANNGLNQGMLFYIELKVNGCVIVCAVNKQEVKLREALKGEEK